MGEHPVVSKRDAEAGEHVEADEQAQLKRPDGLVPKQHDRHDHSHQRQRDADEVDDLVGAGHHGST